MHSEIRIVNLGRGPQLSGKRITVQDLVPYLKTGCPAEEILRWYPTLTREELQIIEVYWRAHQRELLEQDERIRKRTDQQIQQQNEQYPDEDRETRTARMRDLLSKVQNGQGHTG